MVRGLPPRLWPLADWMLDHWGWGILAATAFIVFGGVRWAMGYRASGWRRYALWWLVAVFLLVAAIRHA